MSNKGNAYTITVDGTLYSSSDGSFGSEEVDYVRGPCDSNQGLMQFVLETGTRPQDITWKLARKTGGDILTGGPWADHAGTSVRYVTHQCLVPNACYNLKVNSNGGLSGGSIEVNWNGQNVRSSTFSSGNEDSTEFGQC